MSTIVIGSLVLVGLIGAIRYATTHDLDCGESCTMCEKTCSHRDGKSLVERYRQDHPKMEQMER